MFKTKKGKYQLSFFSLVRAQELASPPRRSFANAYRRLKVRLSLVVEPFLQGSLPYGAKNKNSHLGVFFVLVRAQGLASPPRRSFANAYRRLKVRLSLVVEPFLQGSLPYGAKNKKLPFGSLFCFGTRAGIGCAIASPLRPRSLSLTGVLTSASRPCRTLFPGFSPLWR